MHSLYDQGGDGRSVYGPDGDFIPELKAVLKTPSDHMYAHFADGYENEPLSILDEYMPYIFHVHFKLFEMTEDGEYSMDYREILQYLHDHDYDGYVSTEYEGNRWTMPGSPTVEKEQVLLHQRYIRKCLQEIQG